MKQKGVIALAIPLLFLFLLLAAVVLFILISQGKKNPLSNLIKKEPTVTLQNQYQNPFDKSSQYVNPFSSYKNPFDSLK